MPGLRSAARQAIWTARGRPDGPGGRGCYLWEVLPVLWPPPARIIRCGRRARGGGGALEFLVVPSERRVVLLLPRRPRRAAAGALRAYKVSATARNRWQLYALSLVVRTGLAEVLPERIRIEPATPAGQADVGPADLSGYLCRALGEDVLVSLYVGPARANRKPVLQVLTPDGEIIGFAKVGISPLTRDLVRTEAASLAFLQTASLAHVQAPRLICHGQWRGHEVLVQQAFSGSGRPRNLDELSGAMAEVAGLRGVTTCLLADSQYWRDLRPRLEALSQRDIAADLLRALAGIEPTARATSVAFGSWHGDWTPWNMTLAHGRVLAWDWERFATGVPVGFDAIHYHLQNAIRGGMAAGAAAETVLRTAPAILAPFGVDPFAARLVATLYLVEIGTRYLRDRQADAGARLGRVDAWLLPVLMRNTPGYPARSGGHDGLAGD
jgi:hypothetical protein